MFRRNASRAGRQPARARLTNRGQAFVGAGIAFAVSGSVLGYGDITRVGIFLLVLPLFAVLLSSSRVTRLHLTRSIRPVVLQPDEPAQVRAVFANTGERTSRFGAAQDRIDASLGDRPRYTLPSIPRRGSAVVDYTIRGQVRGVHVMGPAVIEHPDPFGMCTATAVVPARDEVLVLPRTFALSADRLPLATGGDGDAGHSIALHGEQDVSIRAYVEGDELRRIHWPATAHRNELMVRHEDRPEHKRAMLLYDARSTAHRLDGVYSSFEWTISAVASIGLQLRERQYATHLLTPETLVNGHFESASLGPAMVRDLATATECNDATHAQLITHAARMYAGGTTIVAVLTDAPVSGLDQLAASCGRGAVGIAIVIDTDAYRRGSGSEGSAARAVQRTFAGAGWRTIVVGPSTGIPAAWRSVTGSSRAGALLR